MEYGIKGGQVYGFFKGEEGCEDLKVEEKRAEIIDFALL